MDIIVSLSAIVEDGLDASAEVPGVIGAGDAPYPRIPSRESRGSHRDREAECQIRQSTSRQSRGLDFAATTRSTRGKHSSKLGRETRSNTSRFARSASGVTTSFRKRPSEAPRRPRRDPIPARARARRRWPRATRVVEKPSNRRLSRGTRGGIPAASATRCFAHPSRGTAGRSPRAPSMRRTRPWVPRHCPSARTRPRSASARDIRCHRARTRPSVPARTTGPRLTPLWDGSPSPFAQTPPSSPSIARTDGPTFRRALRRGRDGNRPRGRFRVEGIFDDLDPTAHLGKASFGTSTRWDVRDGGAGPGNSPDTRRTPRSRDVLPGDLDARPRCGIPIPGNGHFRGEFPGAAWEGVPHPEHERAMLGSCSPGPATAMNAGGASQASDGTSPACATRAGSNSAVGIASPRFATWGWAARRSTPIPVRGVPSLVRARWA